MIQAASDKQGAEPNVKGYGFHPLTAWCSNVGDNLAVMLRPGSAGSFTVDGAGFSHALVDHLTALNTARTADGSHGRRGRRVEYSVAGRPRSPSSVQTTGVPR